LKALKAIANTTRKTRKEIAEFIDRHSNVSLVADEVAELGKRGLIDTLQGRAPKGMPGGCFIKQAGLDYLTKLEKKQRGKR
jgi:hypothetical protein